MRSSSVVLGLLSDLLERIFLLSCPRLVWSGGDRSLQQCYRSLIDGRGEVVFLFTAEFDGEHGAWAGA